MRSDADYLIMGEARDATALKIALDVTKKGTRRVKMTFHTSDAIDFCFDVATEIVQEFGGDVLSTTIKVAKGYHYLIELCSLRDRSKKRLKGIYELRYNPRTLEITIIQICKYDFMKDSWSYYYEVGEDKEVIGMEENYEALKIFRNELKRLAEDNTIEGDTTFELPYIKYMINKG